MLLEMVWATISHISCDREGPMPSSRRSPAAAGVNMAKAREDLQGWRDPDSGRCDPKVGYGFNSCQSCMSADALGDQPSCFGCVSWTKGPLSKESIDFLLHSGIVEFSASSVLFWALPNSPRHVGTFEHPSQRQQRKRPTQMLGPRLYAPGTRSPCFAR